jgi:hypothetical protein
MQVDAVVPSHDLAQGLDDDLEAGQVSTGSGPPNDQLPTLESVVVQQLSVDGIRDDMNVRVPMAQDLSQRLAEPSCPKYGRTGPDSGA